MGDKAVNSQVQEIARVLLAEGRYETHLETGNLQALVDAGWAARQAGQLLGRPVRVETSRPDEPAEGLVVVAELVDA